MLVGPVALKWPRPEIDIKWKGFDIDFYTGPYYLMQTVPSGALIQKLEYQDNLCQTSLAGGDALLFNIKYQTMHPVNQFFCSTDHGLWSINIVSE